MPCKVFMYLVLPLLMWSCSCTPSKPCQLVPLRWNGRPNAVRPSLVAANSRCPAAGPGAGSSQYGKKGGQKEASWVDASSCDVQQPC
eukprot:6616976-Prymnesium_polylepis.1